MNSDRLLGVQIHLTTRVWYNFFLGFDWKYILRETRDKLKRCGIDDKVQRKCYRNTPLSKKPCGTGTIMMKSIIEIFPALKRTNVFNSLKTLLISLALIMTVSSPSYAAKRSCEGSVRVVYYGRSAEGDDNGAAMRFDISAYYDKKGMSVYSVKRAARRALLNCHRDTLNRKRSLDNHASYHCSDTVTEWASESIVELIADKMVAEEHGTAEDYKDLTIHIDFNITGPYNACKGSRSHEYSLDDNDEVREVF